jgi:uncharacterized protein
MLLFSTDFPHWQFDRPDDAVPSALPPALLEAVMARNSAATYGLEV